MNNYRIADSPRLNVTAKDTGPSVLQITWADMCIAFNHTFQRVDVWSVDDIDLTSVDLEILFRTTARYADEFIIEYSATVVHLFHDISNKTLALRISGVDWDEIDRAYVYFKELFPERVEPEDDTVYANFWAFTAHGPQNNVRRLVTPTWEEVRANYPSTVETALSYVFKPDWRPTAGKLMLLHGVPGTGKTYVIRAMMRSWRKHAEFHVVLDPEKFFGSEPGYMMQVLLGGVGDTPLSSSTSDKWKILIVEDTGELLTRDAKDKSGQGLSRLLNLTDGLLGQGLNIGVIITTNEELGRLHDAIIRDGRCSLNAEFTEFDVNESRVWFKERDIQEFPAKRMTLADMYAIAHGVVRQEPERTIGFR